MLLPQMARITRPGGVVGLQEPDTGSWTSYPRSHVWEALKDAIYTAFRNGGGDPDSGREIYGNLRKLALEEVQVRVAIIALRDHHPYMRLAVQFASALRTRIIGDGLMNEAELDLAVAECEAIAGDPSAAAITFTVTQAVGRKPMVN